LYLDYSNHNKKTMNAEWFIVVVLWFLYLGLLSIWVSKTLRILIWNYIAGSTCLFLSLGINLFIRLLDQSHESMSFIKQPDALLGFLNNNYALVIITTYLIFIIISFRSSIMNGHVNAIKKIFYYICLTPLAAISIMFTITVLVVWPEILTIWWFDTFVTNLNIWNKWIRMLVDFSPFIMVITPILIMILSYRIWLPKISLPKMDLKKKEKKNKSVETELLWEEPAPIIDSWGK